MITAEKNSLIEALLDEASDVDLVCYLARSGGDAALKDLLECMRDAESLSTDDLRHNLDVVRQKTAEAHACPMHRVFRRLMKAETMPVVPGMAAQNGLGVSGSLH